jgi:hypothetical protein
VPEQAATEFEMVLNLKTAKTLGITVSVDDARPRRRGDRIGLPTSVHDAVDGSSTGT